MVVSSDEWCVVVDTEYDERIIRAGVGVFRQLGGVSRRDVVLLGRGQRLERDALRSGAEESLSFVSGKQELLLAVGQVERRHDLVDRLRCLSQQDLGRGVGD